MNEAGLEYTADLEDSLVKILNQVSPDDSKKLSDYVLANMDKKSLSYLDICAYKNELPDGGSVLEKLGLAIELDL